MQERLTAWRSGRDNYIDATFQVMEGNSHWASQWQANGQAKHKEAWRYNITINVYLGRVERSLYGTTKVDAVDGRVGGPCVSWRPLM